jgi:hypothetical protein
MKYSLALAAFAAAAVAKEMPRDAERHAELYESGVMHERIMAAKSEQLSHDQQMGVMSSMAGPVYPELPFAQCKNGTAVPFRGNTAISFRCNNVCIFSNYHLARYTNAICQANLHHFLSHTDLGSKTGLGSSSWGWVSDDGREFAIIAQADGAAFAQVSHLFTEKCALLTIIFRSRRLDSFAI